MSGVGGASLAGTALEAARAGAEVAAQGFRKGARAALKGAIDLVTVYDTAAEARVVETLRAARPKDRILAEEGGALGNGDGAHVWIVDPIDGTTNFAHGHPFFACSVACYRNDEALAGAVVAPALGIEWLAERGGGATRNGRACSVSRVRTLAEALCATGFPYDRHTSDDDNGEAFYRVLKRCQGMRRCGSAAIDLCLVADGTYDAYWESKLKPWDLAAGVLMVREAGGRLTDFAGGPIQLDVGEIAASGGPLHEVLLAQVNGPSP
ncbi:MAG: inositol monophosphatase family protein [Myxococcota bacterium]